MSDTPLERRVEQLVFGFFVRYVKAVRSWLEVPAELRRHQRRGLCFWDSFTRHVRVGHLG